MSVGGVVDIAPWAELGIFALGVVGAIVACTNSVNKSEARQIKRANAIDSASRERAAQLETKWLEVISKEISTVGRETGEAVTAVRLKIHEVETWSRDEFVRREEFRTSVEQFNRNVDGLRAYTESRDKLMDEKVERLRTEISVKLDKLIDRK